MTRGEDPTTRRAALALAALAAFGICACTAEPEADDDVATDDDTVDDDDTGPPPAPDEDGDGFGADVDCDDGDAGTYPGSPVTEVPGDGIDPNCDGIDACVDLNCDGRPDLVFPQTSDDSGYLIDSSVYLGTGVGYIVSSRLALPTVGAMGAVARDLDGDGYQDLAFANVSDGELRAVDSYVYWGGAEGFSEERRSGLPTVGASHVAAHDVDRDGFVDLVFSNRWNGSGVDAESYHNDSYIYWGGQDGFDSERRTGLETYGASHSAVADLDADGFEDVVFANGSLFTASSFVYWGSAEGWSGEDRTELFTVAPEAVAVADVDGDGSLDLVFSQWCLFSGCETESYVYFGSAGGFSETDRAGFAVPGATDAAAADLDADGSLDLAFAGGGSFDTPYSVLYFGSGGGFDPAEAVELPTYSASGVAARDLDGDGHLDLVFASFYAPDGEDEVSQVFWGSEGGFDPEVRSDLPTVAAAGIAIAGPGGP